MTMDFLGCNAEQHRLVSSWIKIDITLVIVLAGDGRIVRCGVQVSSGMLLLLVICFIYYEIYRLCRSPAPPGDAVPPSVRKLTAGDYMTIKKKTP